MSVDDTNPYASPKANVLLPEPPFVSSHNWRGHTVTVESRALASRLWLFTGYIITIDGISFVTSQFRPTENFRWSFQDSNKTVTGHFQTHGVNNGIARTYSLTLDDEPLGTFQLRITDGWKSYVVTAVISAICMLYLAWQWLPRKP